MRVLETLFFINKTIKNLKEKMSTLTGNDVMGLMEAYQAVYAPQELTEEQVWEEVENWVNTLIEEGYDLSDYTWEEMFEAYIEEQGGGGSAAPRNQNVFKFPTSSAGTRRGAAAGTRSTSAPSTPAPPTPKTAAPTAAAPPTPKTAAPTAAAAPPKPAAPRPSGTTPAAKPAPKPAGSAMDQWAKANPKLAAAKAERDRTRGTSSTTNPLMADMKSRLPSAAPKVAPSNTLSNTVASSKLKKEEYDAYDLVLEYLLSQGHADTLEEANYVMLELDAEMIGDIVEVMTPPPPVKAPPKTTEGKKVPQITGDGKGKPMGGPYND